MKRRNDKQNVKLLGVASAVGVAAVAVSLLAAYSATMKRLVPTSGSGDSEYVYISSGTNNKDDDVPVQGSIGGVPLEPTVSTHYDKPENSSEPSAEANKPVTATIGNIMPVEGEISHEFSNGELVKSETLGVWKTHDGIDILCDEGTEVKSMSEGVVKMIDSSTIWGVCVTVEQSNGLEVQYCGLAKELNVKTGALVKQGEIIGKTGNTNQAELLQEPHIHIGVKQGNSWIDPLSVIDN